LRWLRADQLRRAIRLRMATLGDPLRRHGRFLRYAKLGARMRSTTGLRMDSRMRGDAHAMRIDIERIVSAAARLHVGLRRSDKLFLGQRLRISVWSNYPRLHGCLPDSMGPPRSPDDRWLRSSGSNSRRGATRSTGRRVDVRSLNADRRELGRCQNFPARRRRFCTRRRRTASERCGASSALRWRGTSVCGLWCGLWVNARLSCFGNVLRAGLLVL